MWPFSAEAQQEARQYVTANFGTDYVPDEPPVYKTRAKGAQEAHEAIRPTLVGRSPQALKNHLTRDQLRLYKLIWDRFVASQMAPAVYDTVSADIYAGEAAVAVTPAAVHVPGDGVGHCVLPVSWPCTKRRSRPTGRMMISRKTRCRPL